MKDSLAMIRCMGTAGCSLKMGAITWVNSNSIRCVGRVSIYKPMVRSKKDNSKIMFISVQPNLFLKPLHHNQGDQIIEIIN